MNDDNSGPIWQDRADSDQTAADSDQTAADSDQTAAERDEADAAADQRAADADQASADRLPPDGTAAGIEAHEATRAARRLSRISRLGTHAAREMTGRARAEAAEVRDRAAVQRDEMARLMDSRAAAAERSIGSSDDEIVSKLEELRAIAAAARNHAAADRASAAQDRAVAAEERARLQAELHMAHLDDLTGAFRRGMGMLALKHEIDRAVRAGGRLVVAFVDVDDLKRINDQDGHVAGDRVLQALVSIMRANLRSFDPIVRYGGDEFVCALGGVDLAEVERRFALIDHALHEAVGAGISLGLAALAAGETLDEVMARADAALLKSKKGRGA